MRTLVDPNWRRQLNTKSPITPGVQYDAGRALHWVPIPMPIAFGWAWVRYYCSWVGMGGHRFCASLHPAPNRSQISRMQGIR